MPFRILSLAVALVGALSLGACDDSGVGPDPAADRVPETRLKFLRFAENAPPLASTVVSFWAVRGEDRGVEIRLAPPPGESEGEEFLEFEVPGDALLQYPDGRAFMGRDSVLITIRVVDATHFRFEFEPSGLRFNPRSPAELEVSYDYADRDIDGDGDRDQEDHEMEREFGFWHQKRSGGLWSKIATVKVEELEEVEAKIFGFSQYALASN